MGMTMAAVSVVMPPITLEYMALNVVGRVVAKLCIRSVTSRNVSTGMLSSVMWSFEISTVPTSVVNAWQSGTICKSRKRGLKFLDGIDVLIFRNECGEQPGVARCCSTRVRSGEELRCSSANPRAWVWCRLIAMAIWKSDPPAPPLSSLALSCNNSGSGAQTTHNFHKSNATYSTSSCFSDLLCSTQGVDSNVACALGLLYAPANITRF